MMIRECSEHMLDIGQGRVGMGKKDDRSQRRPIVQQIWEGILDNGALFEINHFKMIHQMRGTYIIPVC